MKRVSHEEDSGMDKMFPISGMLVKRLDENNDALVNYMKQSRSGTRGDGVAEWSKALVN